MRPKVLTHPPVLNALFLAKIATVKILGISINIISSLFAQSKFSALTSSIWRYYRQFRCVSSEHLQHILEVRHTCQIPSLPNLLPPFCLFGCSLPTVFCSTAHNTVGIMSSWTGRSWSFAQQPGLVGHSWQVCLTSTGRRAAAALLPRTSRFNYGSFHPSLPSQIWSLCTNVTTQFHWAIQPRDWSVSFSISIRDVLKNLYSVILRC